jgi:hypothetical protein
MSSIIFLLSMGLVTFFLIKGHKQDILDREEYLKQIEMTNKKEKEQTREGQVTRQEK